MTANLELSILDINIWNFLSYNGLTVEIYYNIPNDKVMCELYSSFHLMYAYKVYDKEGNEFPVCGVGDTVNEAFEDCIKNISERTIELGNYKKVKINVPKLI